MTNACAGRHNAEVIKSLLTPAQKLIPLPITIHFDTHVVSVGLFTGVTINHHRMINDQINRINRIYHCRIAPFRSNRVTHSGEINNGWHAGKILHQHTRWHKGNFMIRTAGIRPGHQGFYILNGGKSLIMMT